MLGMLKKDKKLPAKVSKESVKETKARATVKDSSKRSSANKNAKVARTTIGSIDKNQKYVYPSFLQKKGEDTADENIKEETVSKEKEKFNFAGGNISQATMNKLLKKNTQELMSSLTPEVRRAFETLYDRIDVTDSGGITAKEIQNLIFKHTSKHVTITEVQQVLHDLDMKGTGDIEFDEFIFMLSQPENYIRLLDSTDIKKLLNDILDKKLKQRLNELIKNKPQMANSPTDTFFKALRVATQQDSTTALRTFYINRLKKLNDHVIHDWSAGQRCIGLSDQEMLTRYETIQEELLRQRVNFCKDNSYRLSPYARPLEWGLVTLRKGIEERRLKMFQSAKDKTKQARPKISEFVVTTKAVPLPKYIIRKRHPLKKTFDYDQLGGIRDKVDIIADTYYNDLKDVAKANSKFVKKALAVEDIKQLTSRQNFHWTFKAYCAPFVVSPWIPMPRPTLQASFTPLGKSKLACQRKW